MIELKWERIDDIGQISSSSSASERVKVPGGWLIRTRIRDGGGLTFVPDPNHSWK